VDNPGCNRRAVPLGACLALILCQTAAAENWYRWVDSKGAVHVQREAPMGTSYDQVQIPDPIPWKTRPDLPAEVTDEARASTQDLFKSASASVYLVLGLPQNGRSDADPIVFGSAVAVSESQLLTNCHVTDAAGQELYIGVDGPDKIVKAEVVALDYAADRCVVSESEVRLHPVAGLRRYDSLEIGETVYAIGNPARLERTLSNGLLSGKRVIEEMRYLQTTAPISHGSSGGGLFDSRGNLIGITAMTLRGTQNINFAIPAEDFWR
jgi:S1-C subfamily serine protease